MNIADVMVPEKSEFKGKSSDRCIRKSTRQRRGSEVASSGKEGLYKNAHFIHNHAVDMGF